MKGSTISIVGLGKLGASMAASFASKGFNVIGVDVNETTVNFVNSRKAPVKETGIDEMFDRNKERLRATLSFDEAVLGSDVTFVIVPTPSKDDGAFSLEFVRSAFAQIGKSLRKKNEYHLVVLTSTVLPGATRYALLPLLAKKSGKEPGRDFGLCYSPEFIALGSIIHDFLNPDFTLIGELDDRSGSTLERIYDQLVENGAQASRMSLENAELTKLSVNTFVTSKIAFANMLASICERLPGGDVDVVTEALGRDTRIGRKYLTGALGYGGPCFPRDNAALSYLARFLGVDPSLAEVTDQMNRSLASSWGHRIAEEVQPGSTVAVLGLSYKPFSHVTEESQAVELAEFLSGRGFRVLAYDPLSGDMALDEKRWSFEVLDSAAECIGQASAVVITTSDPEFAKLSEIDLAGEPTRKKVFDAWRLLRPGLQGSADLDYIGIGLCQNSESKTELLSELWEESELETTGASAGL